MSYTSPEVYEFISQETNDPIVERKTCAVSGTKFAVFQSDVDFYTKISPTFDGVKFPIPTPALCPEERQRRRLAWRNERRLYRNTCALSGEAVISFVSPDKPYPIYKRDLRFSDAYDPLSYGRDFDFSKTFTEQFQDLLNVVPRFSVQQQNPMENSGYCNCASNCKNCYYLFDSDYCEASYYSNVLKHSDHCVDCSVVNNSQTSYECINCSKCFACKHCQYSINCNNSHYLMDCIQCSDCFGCANLCIFNKQYSKEEYTAIIQTLLDDEMTQEKVEKFLASQPRRATYSSQTERSFGHNIVEAKKSSFCYNVAHVDECKYCDFIYNSQNCQDVSSLGENMSWVYDSVSVGINSTRVLFSSTVVVDSSDILYSYMCFPLVKHCFGCVGMKNNSYCILNKQYSKEEYEILVAKIITHMQKTGERGEFFHPSLSPFGYNETVAQEIFPLSAEQAKSKGYPWIYHNYDAKVPEGTTILQKRDLPSTQEATEDICSQIIECDSSKRPFRITKQELVWYKKNNVSLPYLHPDIRHQQRRDKSGTRAFFLRECDQTGVTILSIYPKNTGFKVYSQEAYDAAVY